MAHGTIGLKIHLGFICRSGSPITVSRLTPRAKEARAVSINDSIALAFWRYGLKVFYAWGTFTLTHFITLAIGLLLILGLYGLGRLLKDPCRKWVYFGFSLLGCGVIIFHLVM